MGVRFRGNYLLQIMGTRFYLEKVLSLSVSIRVKPKNGNKEQLFYFGILQQRNFHVQNSWFSKLFVLFVFEPHYMPLFILNFLEFTRSFKY